MRVKVGGLSLFIEMECNWAGLFIMDYHGENTLIKILFFALSYFTRYYHLQIQWRDDFRFLLRLRHFAIVNTPVSFTKLRERYARGI